jgi:hypothetical protein
MAAMKHFEEDSNQEQKVAEAQKNISVIRRAPIMNDKTREAVYIALPDGASWMKLGQKHEWVPGQDEFYAILGTENGIGSMFMLKDHLHEMQKTISKISVLPGDTLEFHLQPL